VGPAGPGSRLKAASPAEASSHASVFGRVQSKSSWRVGAARRSIHVKTPVATRRYNYGKVRKTGFFRRRQAAIKAKFNRGS